MHYALKPAGYLMVGSAESLGSFTDHFNLLDKKYRIHQKKNTASRLITYFTGVDPALRRPGDFKAAKTTPVGFNVEREVERTLANRFVPASIVLSAQAQGQQIVGVGILGMRERLSQLGGTLEIESSKKGTFVRASVPETTETR